MKPELYQEIVAKRPELAVRMGRIKDEVLVHKESLGWLFEKAMTGVGTHVTLRLYDSVAEALIFKHWTEMLPEKHGVVKHGLLKWGDSWAVGVDTKADGFQFLCVENTPLDALTEFWRTYEGG